MTRQKRRFVTVFRTLDLDHLDAFSIGSRRNHWCDSAENSTSSIFPDLPSICEVLSKSILLPMR